MEEEINTFPILSFAVPLHNTMLFLGRKKTIKSIKSSEEKGEHISFKCKQLIQKLMFQRSQQYLNLIHNKCLNIITKDFLIWFYISMSIFRIFPVSGERYLLQKN